MRSDCWYSAAGHNTAVSCHRNTAAVTDHNIVADYYYIGHFHNTDHIVTATIVADCPCLWRLLSCSPNTTSSRPGRRAAGWTELAACVPRHPDSSPAC